MLTPFSYAGSARRLVRSASRSQPFNLGLNLVGFLLWLLLSLSVVFALDQK